MQHLGYQPTNPDDPVARGQEVREVIENAGRFSELSEHDRRRHVVAPAVESTETWCIAAFHQVGSDPEVIRGQLLVDEFMTVLHRSEGRPVREFSGIDKSRVRREKFCSIHASGTDRLEEQCFHYRELVKALVAVHEELRTGNG